LGFAQFHAPTRDNPFMPSEELERLRVEHHPMIYRQEFEAEFVDLSGFALFDVTHMMLDNEPFPTPTMSETVFAVIDSGMKGGFEHDASAVVYCAYNAHLSPQGLTILDWEAVELGAGDMDGWLRAVAGRLYGLGKDKTLYGRYPIYFEDAAAGSMMLARAPELHIDAMPVPSSWTSWGKDLRALAAEPHVRQARAHDRRRPRQNVNAQGGGAKSPARSTCRLPHRRQSGSQAGG
jgi:hypothetical protein